LVRAAGAAFGGPGDDVNADVVDVDVVVVVDVEPIIAQRNAIGIRRRDSPSESFQRGRDGGL
jgi:hypothetical protein